MSKHHTKYTITVKFGPLTLIEQDCRLDLDYDHENGICEVDEITFTYGGKPVVMPNSHTYFDFLIKNGLSDLDWDYLNDFCRQDYADTHS